MILHRAPGKCERYNVKIVASNPPSTIERNGIFVWARQCPTAPEIWISEGNNEFSVFVYARESPWSKSLVFENYIPKVYYLFR